MPMAYTIQYFNVSVQAELDGWPPGLLARYRALALRMLDYGPNLGMPHTRSLGRGLYEIRTNSQIQETSRRLKKGQPPQVFPPGARL
jgi:hypothetical protein